MEVNITDSPIAGPGCLLRAGPYEQVPSTVLTFELERFFGFATFVFHNAR